MSYVDFSKRLETVCGISITPFYEGSKEINWDGLKENIEFLINNGVEVIVPCGNTSEFYALTPEEAKEEIKRVVEIVDGRAKVVAGIGYSLHTAISFAQYAEAVGADAVMIHTPIHPYITESGLTSYLRKIIDSVNIPSILYYKDPEISDNVLKELAPLEKLVGIKYAINNLPRFAKIVQEVPKEHNVTWICGTAEKWAPFYFNAGAKGFTSGLVNLYPQKSLEMLKALQENDQNTVWNVWKEILPFEDLRAKYNNGNNVVIIKEAMELLGLTAGVTREPVNPLNKHDREEVVQLLRSWGFELKIDKVAN
ncbi:dihydrodipicolinate synthase family protein [Bacillus sp. Marseille-P3661]|uniref:dihydrodipicolinate synthase family protein n=1 Tax=Bacillus sp. Marseille-P3661 TaxID=1936234 RepID=UPI000C8489D2|nr:dihydrodipicolinate synthase family protein [Bacillus sp. Marseille-P3661]